MVDNSREKRKFSKIINYIEGFPGADLTQDAVRVVLIGDELSEDIGATVSGVVDVQEDTPLDVSGATVTVTDDGSLDINSLPEPLDVSGAVVSVQEDTPLDVSGATVDVNVNNLPDVLTNESYGVDIENDVQRTLTVGSYSLVDVSITTSVSTSATVEKSWDGNNWFEVESFSNTSKVDDNLRGAGGTQYRVTVSGTGAGGDTADIVIAAKSR
jgi:hypothetical protein